MQKSYLTNSEISTKKIPVLQNLISLTADTQKSNQNLTSNAPRSDKKNTSKSSSKSSSKMAQNDAYFLIHGNKASTPHKQGLYSPDLSLTDASKITHEKRLSRYAFAHKRSVDFSLWIKKNHTSKPALALAFDLQNCSSQLVFRNYFTVKKMLLHSMCSCKKHILCQLCAIRRGSKAVDAYMSKILQILLDHPTIKFSLVTFTVKNGESLSDRFNHLKRSLQKLHAQRKRALSNSSRNLPNEANKALGAVWSYEAKKGSNSSLWHPHVHAVWLHYDDLNEDQLSKEWLSITGDSHIVNITPFHTDKDILNGFLEVFKYAVKFSDLPYSDNWHAYEVLLRERLVASFGLFRGVVIPESLTDEPLENLPYVEYFYDFIKNSYKLQKKHFQLN